MCLFPTIYQCNKYCPRFDTCVCIFFNIVLRSVHRSIQLRCLEINTCYAISGEVFCEAVKKLPFLEELHLSNTYLSKEIIVVTGRYCPLLKSFKCNYNAVRWSEYDSVALAIAENMPQLQHLQLLKNIMTNEGPRAILDNCCHLESVDVRDCFNVDLTGDLGKRCRQQIMDLRPSNDDFAKDYYFDDGSWYSDNLSEFSDFYVVSWYSSSHEDNLSEFSDFDDDDYYNFSEYDGYEELFDKKNY